MLEEYAEFCYNQVGSYVLDLVQYFEDLRPQLSKAGIEISLPEYLSMMFFTIGIVGLFTLTVGGTAMVLTSGLAGIMMAFIASIVLSVVTALGFYIYPSIMISSRASRIKDTLPFATMYLATLSGTGTPLPKIFQNLSEVDEYGEVSREAENIARDINTFGMDVSEALERSANRSPSEDYKELMWGINHVITTGGSLRDFLNQRAESLMNNYKRRIEEFSEQLSLLVEMYITVVVVGSIIFTSMSAVMSTISQNMTPDQIVALQIGAIFFGLPLISGMFILLVQGMAPGGIR
ncbi:MAG: type II secretion system F family protein [Candidatus Nanohaloarchaea archaeon]